MFVWAAEGSQRQVLLSDAASMLQSCLPRPLKGGVFVVCAWFGLLGCRRRPDASAVLIRGAILDEQRGDGDGTVPHCSRGSG